MWSDLRYVLKLETVRFAGKLDDVDFRKFWANFGPYNWNTHNIRWRRWNREYLRKDCVPFFILHLTHQVENRMGIKQAFTWSRDAQNQVTNCVQDRVYYIIITGPEQIIHVQLFAELWFGWGEGMIVL